MRKSTSTNVSVLIPIYNAERYLYQALESLRQQKSERLEFLCINDGSTDNSLEIVHEFSAQDNRFKVISKENSGYGASMNLGIQQSAGYYIAIFEPDDYIEGQMYSDLYTMAEKRGFPDVVKSSYWSVDDSQGEVQKFRCGYWKRIKNKDTLFTIKEEPILTRYHPSIWTALYRKDFLQTNQIRFKEVPGAGWVDNPFMMETLLKAHSIAYTDNAYYCYRDAHSDSSTANIADMNMPVDRWLEMTEIMEQNSSAVTQELWSIHAYKAFHYLDYAKQAKNFDPDEWLNLAKKVLSKLSPAVVANSKYLSHEQKCDYERITGVSLPLWSDNAYKKMLLSEAFWKTRQNGLAFMLNRAKRQ